MRNLWNVLNLIVRFKQCFLIIGHWFLKLDYSKCNHIASNVAKPRDSLDKYKNCFHAKDTFFSTLIQHIKSVRAVLHRHKIVTTLEHYNGSNDYKLCEEQSQDKGLSVKY